MNDPKCVVCGETDPADLHRQDDGSYWCQSCANEADDDDSLGYCVCGASLTDNGWCTDPACDYSA